jgi:hypothetical protein
MLYRRHGLCWELQSRLGVDVLNPPSLEVHYVALPWGYHWRVVVSVGSCLNGLHESELQSDTEPLISDNELLPNATVFVFIHWPVIQTRINTRFILLSERNDPKRWIGDERHSDRRGWPRIFLQSR